MDGRDLIRRIVNEHYGILKFGPEDWDGRVIVEGVIESMIMIEYGTTTTTVMAREILAEMVKRLDL